MNMMSSKNPLFVNTFFVLAVSGVVVGCKPAPGERPGSDRYSKVDAQGNLLDDSAPSWDCVLDNKTDLLWEKKSATAGKRHADATFTNTTNTSVTPVTARGACESASYNVSGDCHTEGYVAYVNEIALCGYSDWRMPSKDELKTKLFTGLRAPHFDTKYFSNSAGFANLWTGTDINVEGSVPQGEAYRAQVNRLGLYYNDQPRDVPYSVRLVRGAQAAQ